MTPTRSSSRPRWGQCAADGREHLIPMVMLAISNTGRAPDEVLADAGGCSAANLEAAAGLTANDRGGVLQRDRAGPSR